MDKQFFYSKMNRKKMYINSKKTTENYKYLTNTFTRYGQDMRLGDIKHLQPYIYNHNIDNDIRLYHSNYLQINNEKNKAMANGVEKDIKIFDEMHNIKLI